MSKKLDYNAREIGYPSYMDNKIEHLRSFRINVDGNIVITTREKELITDRGRSLDWKLGNKSVKYTVKNREDCVTLSNGSIIYTSPIKLMLMSSYLGWPINILRDIGGRSTINDIVIRGVKLDRYIKIRDGKVNTISENKFYDKWNSVTSNKELILELQGKYFDKWCRNWFSGLSDEEQKEFKNSFLLHYRKAVNGFKSARRSIRPECLAVIGPKAYFIDFYLPSVRVGVEIDGYHHYYNADQFEHDLDRTADLYREFQIILIRVPNNDVDSLSQESLFNIIEYCFDRAGSGSLKLMLKKKVFKTNYIPSVATLALNSQSAAKPPDFSSKYILDGYRKLVELG